MHKENKPGEKWDRLCGRFGFKTETAGYKGLARKWRS